MNHFWCSHNDWTSYLVTWQLMGRYIKVYVWFSANWNKKVALQILTLHDSQAHEKWQYFWCTSNDWTLHHDYWQLLTVITVFVGSFAICRKNDPKTLIGLYWPFLRTKIPERWVIFDALPVNDLCTMFQALLNSL